MTSPELFMMSPQLLMTSPNYSWRHPTIHDVTKLYMMSTLLLYPLFSTLTKTNHLLKCTVMLNAPSNRRPINLQIFNRCPGRLFEALRDEIIHLLTVSNCLLTCHTQKKNFFSTIQLNFFEFDPGVKWKHFLCSFTLLHIVWISCEINGVYKFYTLMWKTDVEKPRLLGF